MHDGKASGQKQVRRPASKGNRAIRATVRTLVDLETGTCEYIYCTVRNTGSGDSYVTWHHFMWP